MQAKKVNPRIYLSLHHQDFRVIRTSIEVALSIDYRARISYL